jgi:integration host factor subunit beta
MLKKDLIHVLVSQREMQQRQAEDIIEHLFDTMGRALARGEAIELRGLGRFQVRQYDGYVGRNPKTAAAMPIGPSRGVLFRTGKELRERLNNHTSPAAKSSESVERKAASASRPHSAENAA